MFPQVVFLARKTPYEPIHRAHILHGFMYHLLTSNRVSWFVLLSAVGCAGRELFLLHSSPRRVSAPGSHTQVEAISLH